MSHPTSPPQIHDDKSPHCIPFILSRLHTYQQTSKTPNRPFIIGLNGVQGAGKTTLVSALKETLKQNEGLETLVLSIDDLYLTHDEQVNLARENEDNKLVQYRGEPGTHDIPLASKVITSLLAGEPTSIPSYNKSLHNGLGDRSPESTWETVNLPSQPPIRVLLLEGWCVGFRSLPSSALRQKVAGQSLTLKSHALSHLEFVNERLKGYDVLTDEFDAFIHIDAEDTGYVYEWREQQEEALRRDKGVGMSKEEVRRFVDGYFPAYELFVEGVRGGVVKGEKGRQLRLVVGRDRRVKEVIEI
ncbi:P-loop containing nucleoside triphosphate hydrolase [Glarea lozoyensis ATCC 20868]|uniref:p-loop containing nucleoside triphosphate hydrolase n=1 Tax=Glarea lozoyensis (strain ATCC 20868 / MF5171) TaxID=1116229 RepID=S3DH43_GLAL2|nr:P-loop containing nucleoside triphosphate hydrolase [Glarea lozoyensis ATCC 20868]EPE31331.1 P-loop containing nucleoside triphosphate hydrolase [Glarea lozoyensis ATCC 20868]